MVVESSRLEVSCVVVVESSCVAGVEVSWVLMVGCSCLAGVQWSSCEVSCNGRV